MAQGHKVTETKIIGIHRSQDLAEKHLRQLGAGWQITGRRRADGHFSRHGRRFIFEFTPPQAPPPPPPPEGDVFEWIISFEYEDSGRSFDVVVTAHDENEAYQTAKEFLAQDAQGSRIVKSGFFGWTVTPVRGESTEEQAGEAEYRSSKGR